MVKTRFEKLADGWIKDELTGLDWAPSSEERMDFADAQKYCADKGGRLPEADELHSLVDFTKHESATNTDIFKDTKHDDWYWTGTKASWRTDASWCVSFYDGNMDLGGYELLGNYVRPCRSSQ